jgi:carbon monoxide dehydrogenase subunit G
MELEHSFTVPVPEDRAWEVLLDVKRVAPCMPGATLDSVEGDDIKGRIKVKVGPIVMTYAGTAHFTERDPNAHVITLEAAGKETRGAGTASATVRSMLEGRGDETHVVVHTTLNVTGRPAQFGRGVMSEVGTKLIGIFASNLADMLAAERAAPGAERAAPGAEPAAPAPAQAAQPAEAEAAPPGAGPAQAPAEPAAAGPAADQPIETLDLTVRSYNGLRREGIQTVGDLASRTREQLLAIDNIGPASVEEIRQKLADRGLALSESAVSGNGVAGAAPPKAAAQHPATVPSATVPPAPAREPASAAPASNAFRDSDDDAIDLLSVAGAPVLKRALPVAAALAAAAVIVLRLRARHRRARR